MDPRLEKRLFIVFCFLLVVFIAVITFYFLSNKETGNSNTRENNNVKYDLNIYKNREGIFCLNESSECQDKVLAIEVLTEDAKVLDVTIDGRFVLYNDQNMKLYDTFNDEYVNIELTGYDEYKIGYDEEIGKVNGVIYYGDKTNDLETGIEEYNTIGFYNISNNKRMYEGSYDSLRVINESYLEGKIVDDTDENDVNVQTFLLDVDEEKSLLSKDGMCESFRIVNGYIVQSSGCIGLLSSTLYTDDLQVIFTDLEDYKWSIDNESNLYVINNLVVNKYDKEGTVIGTSSSYRNILQVIKDYIVYVDNSKLMITNENDVLLEVSEWKSNYSYDGFTSGYRDGDLEFKEGIYLNYYIDDSIVSYYFDESIKTLSLI